MGRSLPPGIFATPFGYRAVQWVPDPARPQGKTKGKRFKPGTPLDTMKRWRDEQRGLARRIPPTVSTGAGRTSVFGTSSLRSDGFAADALTYLQAVKAMPTYANRIRDLSHWIALFGDRPRSTITPAEIRIARDAWLTVGPKRVQAKDETGMRVWIDVATPLAGSTVNQRLRALENLFTVLDGKHAWNPVRDVPEADEAALAPRGQSFALGLEILSCMPDISEAAKGALRERGSFSRARFATMLWTGLPPCQLAGLRPEHVDWPAATIVPPRRAKGRSTRRASRRRLEPPRPLLPQALDALRHLFALGANRAFSTQSLARTVRRAISVANGIRATKGLPPIPATCRVYDLTRHTFGSEIYRATKNLDTVQHLMGHANSSMSARYAKAAIDEGLIMAMQQLEAHATRTTSPPTRRARRSATPSRRPVGRADRRTPK